MVIKLVDGEKTAELEANDNLLLKSFSYAGIFERKVSEVTKAFYGHSKNFVIAEGSLPRPFGNGRGRDVSQKTHSQD